MSMFKDLTTEGVEKSGDVLGGFSLFESDAYEATVKVMYAGEARSGARFLGVHLDIDGKEYRENIYYTNRNGENYYVDKQTGKKKLLPGFQTVNDICLLTTGLPLTEQPTEDKIVKLYDPEAKAETNQSVPVLIDVIGKPLIAGIIKQTVNKQEKTDDGTYVATSETRDENVINKIFHHESQGTVTEYEEDKKLGTFFEAWVAQNKGNTINRAKQVSGPAGRSGSGRPSSGPPQSSTKSLFNK